MRRPKAFFLQTAEDHLANKLHWRKDSLTMWFFLTNYISLPLFCFSIRLHWLTGVLTGLCQRCWVSSPSSPIYDWFFCRRWKTSHHTSAFHNVPSPKIQTCRWICKADTACIFLGQKMDSSEYDRQLGVWATLIDGHLYNVLFSKFLVHKDSVLSSWVSERCFCLQNIF